MLVIRSARFEMFEAAANAELLPACVGQAREQLSELVEDIDDDTVTAWVREGIDRARTLGLTDA
jgi:hypothetical protein